MNRITHLQPDSLLHLTQEVKAAALGYQGVPEIGFHCPIFYWQVQLQVKAVGGEGEASKLGKGITQTTTGDQRRGDHCGINLVTSQTVSSIEAVQTQVRLQTMVGQVNIGVIVGKLLA